MPVVPAGEVLPGMLVFLDCGCSGIRGAMATDTPVVVMVHRPCAEHASKGPGHLRMFELWDLVSPLEKFESSS
jgi:hypothetical protein